jgi:hypothetical protein
MRLGKAERFAGAARVLPSDVTQPNGPVWSPVDAM